MAGIYLHIPFCKQACHYCDFHFSTSLKTKDDVLNAMQKEIELQKNYLEGESIESIYFGGGTPSILTADEIKSLLATISEIHDTSQLKEVTIEANPDDLNAEKIRQLKEASINRFSIGIQSFFDKDLQFLNRAHNAKEAISSIKKAQDFGFDNITIDLIYGIPNSDLQRWEWNLEKAFELNVPHLSCYSLTIEEKTVFGNWLKKGKINMVDDETVNQQFMKLMEKAEQQGFQHYEISNFAKPNYRAIHNSNYWSNIKYLGIGPGAHSYNHDSRQFNISNNVKYVSQIREGKRWFESEALTTENKINEYILTTLRTDKGISLDTLLTTYNYDLIKSNNTIKYWLDHKKIHIHNGFIQLTKEGKLLCDSISEDLFI